MLLRRITEHVKAQNWTAIALDFVIVVVGIFVGLQIDNWNKDRKDRVDEVIFLKALHEDLLRADELSLRLRQRRLDRWNWTLAAGDVLFRRSERDELTDDECASIVWSTAFNFIASGLPSVDELIGTGRMGIIRDTELRTELFALEQTRTALDQTISEKTASSNFVSLPVLFPDYFEMIANVDDARGEVATINKCHLDAMRANQDFLNQFSANADGYDAYIRDGLRPWSNQFNKVHGLVDGALVIKHSIVRRNE